MESVLPVLLQVLVQVSAGIVADLLQLLLGLLHDPVYLLRYHCLGLLSPEPVAPPAQTGILPEPTQHSLRLPDLPVRPLPPTAP